MVAQGTYDKQLNLGDVRRRRQERPLLVDLAFDNGFADHGAAFKRLNDNNPATSSTNLFEGCPFVIRLEICHFC